MPKRFHAILEIVARNPVTATVSVPNDNIGDNDDRNDGRENGRNTRRGNSGNR